MLDNIINEIKNGALNAIAKKTGISADKGLEICKEFIPEAMGQVNSVMQNPEKMSAMMGKFMGGDFSKYLDDNEDNFDDTAEKEGKGILSILFDNLDLDSKVTNVAGKTGIEFDSIKKFLPLITAALMGAVSKNAGSLLSGLGGGEGSNPLESLLGGDSSDLLGSLSNFGGFLKK